MAVTVSEDFYNDLQLLRERDREYIEGERARIRAEQRAELSEELEAWQERLAAAVVELGTAQKVITKTRDKRDKARAALTEIEHKLRLDLGAKSRAAHGVKDAEQEIERLELQLRQLGGDVV